MIESLRIMMLPEPLIYLIAYRQGKTAARHPSASEIRERVLLRMQKGGHKE